jgi:nitroreductase/NAD-dependent dihydropyrimidine dehydrogenase PreA subunit
MEIFHVNEETCSQCGACAAVCHFGIIDFQDKSYPKPLPIADQACSKCGACVVVCPTESFIHRDISYDDCPPINESLKVSYDQCAQLLKARRSTRSFKDKPVPRDIILQAIDAARYSPTGINAQYVRWLVIDDKDKVESFRKSGAEFVVQLMKNSFLSYLMPVFEKRKEAGIDDFLHGAPVIVSAYAEKDNPSHVIPCSIALAYFDLAAISLGLGCCWDGFFEAASNYFPPIKDAIALPEGYKIYGSMAVGYPKYSYHRIPKRNPARITWQ